MAGKRIDKRRPTINDVARLAGVSKKTVSRAINSSPFLSSVTRDRVTAVIADLGYVPNPQARALALRRNFLLGLIHDNPNAQMVLNAQEGILEALRDTEFALVMRPVDRRSSTLLRDIGSFLQQQRVYGVLLLPPISENDGVAALCREMGCGYVRMGSATLDDGEHLVQSNDRAAVAEAVAYLIELGHRNIGLITGPDGFRSSQERQQGFLDAFARHGFTLAPELVAKGYYTFETGLSAAEQLLDGPTRPTAIFCSNDEMAAGALHAARQRGIDVPAQLSLVGFDDTAIATHIWPPLTTVRWPIRTMARTAALKLIDPERAAQQAASFPSDLVRRASAVAPPGPDGEPLTPDR
jgi:LacI family transcriptional regulator